MKPAVLLTFLFLSCSACLMADNAALAAKAREQIGVTVSYNGGYQTIPYPNGDVPKETGVCTDVVIRAMRAFGLDLQKAVHEDMKAHFSKYPKLWGLKTTDRSIDHRRVPNLRAFFCPEGMVRSHYGNRGGLQARRPGYVEPVRQCSPHRHRFRPEDEGRNAADYSQRRLRCAGGRLPLLPYHHGPLPPCAEAVTLQIGFFPEIPWFQGKFL